MVFRLSVYFVVIFVFINGVPFDVDKYKTIPTITENTKVVDLFLDHNRVFLSALGNSTPFTYPVGCSPTQRRFLEQYCVVGTYTVGEETCISLDLYIYDANDNSKTVRLGATASFKDAKPTCLTSRASGCADLVDQTLSYGSLRGIVHACMSTSKVNATYNPTTKQYTIPSNISSNVILRGYGRDLLNDNYILDGYFYTGADFNLGTAASVGRGVEREGIYSGNFSFDVSFGTVANDLFAWHAFAGLRSSAQLLDLRPAYASYPFVDLILNIKP